MSGAFDDESDGEKEGVYVHILVLSDHHNLYSPFLTFIVVPFGSVHLIGVHKKVRQP